jgi:hypothetical protein
LNNDANLQFKSYVDHVDNWVIAILVHRRQRWQRTQMHPHDDVDVVTSMAVTPAMPPVTDVSVSRNCCRSSDCTEKRSEVGIPGTTNAGGLTVVNSDVNAYNDYCWTRELIGDHLLLCSTRRRVRQSLRKSATGFLAVITFLGFAVVAQPAVARAAASGAPNLSAPPKPRT